MAAGQEDKRQPWVISVRIPRDIEPRLRQLAQRRVVPPAILLRQLIVERLEQIERGEQERER
jgi:predicted DNA-binding protein